MRRALRYTAIWCGATVVAVSVSWFGVRGVLRSEFADDVHVRPFLAQTVADDNGAPLDPPVTRAAGSPEPRRTPGATPTSRRTGPTPAPARTSARPTGPAASQAAATRPPTAGAPAKPAVTAPAATPAKTSSGTPTRTPSPTAQAARTTAPAPAAQAAGDVKVVTVKGGEVAFEIGSTGCRLVSATPNSGYTAKVTRNDGWIRVDLINGEHGSAVFCISAEKRTDTWEY
ncbi:hypothetical protein HII36_14310 [Nonomuraea sp. NN258]|uniref:hypothetical protein n=1 Tax=Nonomuraea antri TaxID=2730852 RepID=UPI001568074D|nr:hypothetical protein [Nonomuraea antri]NRQ33005.1 hypothetical protein [Nonomuraea antri]